MKRINVIKHEQSYNLREEIKTLRTNIQFCGSDKKVILVTSCLPGEGKTTTAFEIAQSFAELKKNVLLIDADLRKSMIISRLGIEGEVEHGLSHFLSGQCNLSDVVLSTNIPKLHVMVAGPTVPNPTELLSSDRFSSMLKSCKEVYDYIFIDSAPLGAVIDGAIIGKECDGSIMLMESGTVKYKLAQEVKSKLENAKCPLLGVVFNKADIKRQKGYYGQSYQKRYEKYGE